MKNKKMDRPSSRDETPEDQSKYDPENSQSLRQTRSNESPVTSSPGQTAYVGSHAENYDPQHPDRNVPEDGPSGENTSNAENRGGGLWTSGGTVVSGTAYHDEDDSSD